MLSPIANEGGRDSILNISMLDNWEANDEVTGRRSSLARVVWESTPVKGGGDVSMNMNLNSSFVVQEQMIVHEMGIDDIARRHVISVFLTSCKFHEHNGHAEEAGVPSSSQILMNGNKAQ